MSDQRRWTDKDLIDTLADDDLLLVADTSQPDGSRDRTVEILTLRAWLQSGLTLWGTITGDLSDQADLWAALQSAQIWPVKSISLSSSSYGVTVGDEFHVLTFSAGGFGSPPSRNITLPTNANVAFPVGTRLEVIRLDDETDPSAATVSFNGQSGVTVHGAGGNLQQYRKHQALKIDTDTWVVSF